MNNLSDSYKRLYQTIVLMSTKISWLELYCFCGGFALFCLEGLSRGGLGARCFAAFYLAAGDIVFVPKEW